MWRFGLFHLTGQELGQLCTPSTTLSKETSSLMGGSNAIIAVLKLTNTLQCYFTWLRKHEILVPASASLDMSV